MIDAFDRPTPSIAGDTAAEGDSGAAARANHRHDRTTDAASAAAAAAATTAAAPPGTVSAYVGAAAPTGWLLCDGTAVSRSTYAALFAACGTTYGAGDGSATFNLPDLRGRVIVAVDGGAGRVTANNTLGASSGSEAHTHTEAAHAHTLSDAGQAAIAIVSGTPSIIQRRVNTATWTETHTISTTAAATGTATSNLGAALLGSTDSASPGSTGSTNSLPPYLVLNYIVKF